MKKVLMIATVPSMIGQFNMENIELLLQMGYDVHVACNFNDRSVWTEEKVRKFEEQLESMGVRKIQIEFARTPYDILRLMKAYKEIKSVIKKENYVMLHCHTPVASMIARLAARGSSTKVIYTAHGFHFYKGAPLLNWLIYYPIEKWLSRYTDVLITINKEDYQRAKRKFHAKETKYIPGVGIDVEKIQAVQVDRDAKRRELGIEPDDFLLLSVGELSKRKNQQVIIKAIARLNDTKIKYFICGQGLLKQQLEKEIENLNIKSQVKLLGFRTDIIELCKIADLFAFPSLQEGLPVALMEAMTCGLPCVVSKIRGNVDLVEKGVNGFVFENKKDKEIEESIHQAIENNTIRHSMKLENEKKMMAYDVKIVREDIKKIYEETI